MRSSAASTCLVFLALSGWISGCDNPCEDLLDEIYFIWDDCGVDTGGSAYQPLECTEGLQNALVCFRACYENATCEAINGSDPDGHGKVRACEDYCLYFLY